MLNLIKQYVIFFVFFAAQYCYAQETLAGHHQLLAVTARDWDEKQGCLQLYERLTDESPWTPIGESIPIVLGRAGLAWGIGLHPLSITKAPYKVEGDGKSPAGFFSLGDAFGFASGDEMSHLKIGYFSLNESIEAVDDPESLYYNCVVNNKDVPIHDWLSSEKMGNEPLYANGVVIHHNFPNPKPGAGSAIFLHIWRNQGSGTAGCTAMSQKDITAVFSWLDRDKSPVLVQLPIATYCKLQNEWNLPKMDKHALGLAFNLVNLSVINPDIVFDIRYAVSNNFLGVPVYPKAVCYLHKEAAEALNQVQQELSSKQLGLKVFDGYRPLSVQQVMWDAIQDERYVSNPAKNKGRHTRGTAIDLTLIDQKGNELEMPTGFDDFTERAHSDYSQLSEAALKNRSLLKEVMNRHHFQQLPTEWWHFDFEGWQDDVKYPPLDIGLEELEELSQQ
jgi:zinc D-Ala-D-Ala dipeptidase